jgi:5-methylcytosine-specific restriction enzyme subunit McrC
MGGYRNADLYQLLAYSIALNLPGGTLVYAADEGVTAAEHIVVESGKRLRVVALDLTAPKSNILTQIRSLAASIRPRQVEPEVIGPQRGVA